MRQCGEVVHRDDDYPMRRGDSDSDGDGVDVVGVATVEYITNWCNYSILDQLFENYCDCCANHLWVWI